MKEYFLDFLRKQKAFILREAHCIYFTFFKQQCYKTDSSQHLKVTGCRETHLNLFGYAQIKIWHKTQYIGCSCGKHYYGTFPHQNFPS